MFLKYFVFNYLYQTYLELNFFKSIANNMCICYKIYIILKIDNYDKTDKFFAKF